MPRLNYARTRKRDYNMAVREYTYLDIPGIDSLYVQTCDKVQSALEETTQRTSRAAGKATVKGSLGQLLSFLKLPSAEIDACGELSKEAVTSTKVQYALAPQNKLRIVLEFLKRDRALQDSLEMALRHVSIGGSTFIEVTDFFRLASQDHPALHPIEFVNATQFIRFELVSQYEVNGEACYVQLGGSLYKWFKMAKRRNCHLFPVTHLAIRIMADRVELYTFGNLSRLTVAGYYIKPFAISI